MKAIAFSDKCINLETVVYVYLHKDFPQVTIDIHTVSGYRFSLTGDEALLFYRFYVAHCTTIRVSIDGPTMDGKHSYVPPQLV